MRTVRKYAFGVFLLSALALNGSAFAAPVGSQGDRLTMVRRLIVKILDDVAIKIGLPPG
jgi:hypothetical protein